MKVLVVDDDESLRDVVRDLLIELGCDAVTFTSPEATLRLARHRSLRPDLILLDLAPAWAARICRRLAAVIPGAPIVCVGEGAYESTVETAFAVLRATRRHRTKRNQRLAARISRLEKSNEDLLRLVCVDQLTGVANRRHFEDVLSTEWNRAARSGSPLSLVLLDLDDFHALNERYGHLGGDDCLRRVADAMAHCLRRPSDIVARYGGEEFVALLPDTDAAGACVVAERLRKHVEQLQLPHESSRCSSVVTISAGVATATPRSDQSYETLVTPADVALFRAKEHGRNRIWSDMVVPAAVVASRQAWPPCPIVIADPCLSRPISRLLETKRAEIPMTREALRGLNFAPVSAMGHDLKGTRRAFGFEALTDLGERLEKATVQGDRVDALRLVDELAWYLDHVQVVYQRPVLGTDKTYKRKDRSTRS